MLFMACSPALEKCIEFHEEQPQEFKTLNICKEEATKTLKKIINEFNKKNLPAKVFVTCKEIKKWRA
jgi:predicted deacetylase